MKIFHIFLLLTILCAPAFARPFNYNFYFGPEYWSATSTKANITSNIVTCGFVFRGNIFDLLNAEFRGGAGEISSTKMNFNELSLLYTPVNLFNNFLGYGISLLNYQNILDKASNNTISEQDLAIKIQWEYSFSPRWGFYLKGLYHHIWGYEFGYLSYLDRDFGDFNLSLGYRNLQLNSTSAIRGVFISSNIYF